MALYHLPVVPALLRLHRVTMGCEFYRVAMSTALRLLSRYVFTPLRHLPRYTVRTIPRYAFTALRPYRVTPLSRYYFSALRLRLPARQR